VIAGTIRCLFAEKKTSLNFKDRAYRALTLFYAQRHTDKPFSSDAPAELFGREIFERDAYEELMSELQPDVLESVEHQDPVECLLLWYHQWVTLPYEQTMPEELDRVLDGALDTAKFTVDDAYERILREEQWNQLALLAVELLGGQNRRQWNARANIPVAMIPVAMKLINQVATRLKKQEYRIVEGLPPWGYRCLNHSQRIDLAIAQSKLGELERSILETLQDAYFDCLHFLRSDHSFLRTWDASDPAWLLDQWNLECSSIVSSSFVSIAGLDWSNIATDGDCHSLLIYSLVI
jgi:hypothetical protein